MIFLLLVAFLSGSYVSSDGQNASLASLNNEILEQLDVRVRHLVKDHTLFTKLDQKTAFVNDDAYNRIKTQSLESASKLFPVLLGTLQDISKNAKLAVCPVDRRIFFSMKDNDYEALGWIPVITSDAVDRSSKIVVLLTLKTTASSQFYSDWLSAHTLDEQKARTDTAVKQNLSEDQRSFFSKHLGLHLNPGGTVHVQGSVLHVSTTLTFESREHLTELLLSPRGLAVITDLYPSDGKPLPVELHPEERYLRNYPLALPFWPPKEK